MLGFVGWWQWLHGGPERTRLVVGRSPRWVFVARRRLRDLGTWGLTIVLGAVHDIAPFWDALTTCLSLAAQALLNWKKLENWYFWIAADVIYVPLYVVKRLDLTAIVYVLFLSMCFFGLREWRDGERRRRASAPVAVRVAFRGHMKRFDRRSSSESSGRSTSATPPDTARGLTRRIGYGRRRRR